MSPHVRLPAGYRLLTFDCLDSTNEEAKRQAAAGAVDRTLVWARAQNAGRGRFGRPWASPPGNLYLSMVLRPDCPARQAVQLGMVAAVAAGEALHALCDRATVKLKWPNDVLLNGAKACGILLESSASQQGSLDWLVLGIGINVVSFPEATGFPATSLNAICPTSITVERTLATFVEAFAREFDRWHRLGLEPIRAAWLSRAWRRGEIIQARLENEVLEGRFRDIDESGALLLEIEGGAFRRITAGDVFALPVTA
ncbi:MAG TPA: biotin--[acetyl-CoA-carboxylase] ligase [Alphaproteobacteria bacterium]|nr:biotin--[acetyl-CoA-carboxylase] ligase [Alphaproteobacteria bacterium]